MKHRKLIDNQRGLAAITLTIFILIVLSLLVLAFSQIARREQRQSLDRQLSTQAFYAAESGINDAVKYVRANTTPEEKTKCNDLPTFSANLDSNGTFKEVCVLFDRTPETLEYGSVDTYRGELVSLQTSTNSPPRSITIEWSDTNGGAGSGGNSTFVDCSASDTASLISFPAKGAYPDKCDAGMIKVILMPVFNGLLSRERLVDDSFSIYLRPVKDGSAPSVSYSRHVQGADSQGYVAPSSCNSTTGKCQAVINNLPEASGMFLKMVSIYKDNAVAISGTNAAGGRVSFSEAQAIIDSTGKANDTLKRLQVRIPLYETYDSTPFVMEGMNNICKRLSAYPGSAQDECGSLTVPN